MSVTISWVEYNTSETPGNNVGGAATNINFGSTDATDLTPASYPIAAASNSYFKQLQVNISGSYTKIDNMKLHKSAGDYVTGETLQFSGNIVASTPDATDQSDAVVPTSLPGTANVCPKGGTHAGSLPYNGESESSGGYYSGSRTSLLRFQSLTTGSTPAGATNTKTFTFTYDRQ